MVRQPNSDHRFVLGGVALLKFGMHYGLLFRFYLHKSEYEGIFKELQQRPPRNHQDEKFFYYTNNVIVDQGPPQRIAFELPGGLLDNFQAVVYDPSGLVKETQRFKGDSHWNDTKLDPIKQLFGGEMFFCEPIEGAWYFCWFT